MSANDHADRVAELLVEPADGGPGRRGSGFRVSAGAVLTAAHVVDGAERIRVRFNAERDDERVVAATPLLISRAGDVAVVGIPHREDEGPIEPARFARIGARDAVLPCTATGFPRFKLRDDHARRLPDGDPSQYRDSCHLVGTAPLLSNRKQRTLEVCLDGPPPAPDPDPARSPWEGMSGAAVFSGGLIVGVISEHHRSDGLGRLAATRCDTWFAALPAEDLRRLRELLGLPEDAADLPDAAPASPGALVNAAYTAQVRSLAPEYLLDREEELAELLAFCAGEEPYQWWQAPPWAGKTALTSTFALRPPAGVRVVAFFVTSRLSGENDADAFLRAMIDQLEVLAGEPTVPVAGMSARSGRFLHLLETAARRLRDRGRRLALVVDGLDEDQGAKPSIAYLLPRHPPDGVRVLVTSRLGPGVPGDVPGDHPLRHCRRRRLTSSPYARYLEIQAKNELFDHLSGDPDAEEIIGLVTASGGGLTVTDLCELTGRPRYSLEGRLGSALGRSLRTRRRDGAELYLFAHETLKVIAEETLGDALGAYRERIQAWADMYRRARWPDRTPAYLLRPYVRLLAAEGRTESLLELAADAERHELMLRRSRSDLDALSEITAATELILGGPAPDLTGLVRLSVERDRIGQRGNAVPTRLPAVWARLGQVDFARSLARSLEMATSRVDALSAVAEALVETAPDRAADIVEECCEIAEALPQTRDQVAAWSAIIVPLSRLDPARAHALSVRAEQAPPYYEQERGWMMRGLVDGLIDASMLDRAEQVARAVTDPWHRAETLAALARSSAVTAPADSVRLAAAAWECMSAVEDPWEAALTWGSVAVAVASTAPDRATRAATEARLAVARTDGWRRPGASEGLVQALGAARLFDEAERVATAIPRAYERVSAQAKLITEMVTANSPDRAERLVAAVTTPHERDELNASLAVRLATAGRIEQARRTATGIAAPRRRARAFTAIAAALAKERPYGGTEAAEAAEEALRASWKTSVEPYHRCDVLCAVAAAVAESDPGRADVAALGAWAAAEREAHTSLGEATLRDAAMALAGVGLFTEAELAVSKIDERHALEAARHGLIRQWARRGRFDLAARTASALPHDAEETTKAWHAIAHPENGAGLDDVVASIVDVMVSLGRHGVTDLHDTREAGAAVIRHLSAAGLVDRPERLIDAFASHQFAADARQWSALAEGLAESFPQGAMTSAHEALRQARAVESPTLRAQELSGVAMALTGIDPTLSAHTAQEAWRTASSLTSDTDRDLALQDVVPALGAAHLLEEAEQAARAIGYVHDRRRALADVALRAARAGSEQTGRAVRIVAEILTGDEWYRTLPALAVLEPQAVRLVHDAFSSETDGS
ncbi:serine protease [Actinomadura miaoliensis]|uniref:Nephrocystin 3-like N-terminal domain-containing protein n=1 Tax=Actinomadura miaoliensis TaxID=430685 RepID=A0ABP7X5Z6_9ACTN